MGIVNKVAKYYIIFLCFFFSCTNVDYHNDSYSEELTMDLFVGHVNWEELLAQVHSLRVYEITDGDGFFSEQWLRSNAIRHLEIKDKKNIIKIVSNLKYRENNITKKDFKTRNNEYHIVFEFFNGKKAYLRLRMEDEKTKTYRVRPFGPIVYRIQLTDFFGL